MAEQQKRLNTFISADVFKRVKVWATERDMTLGAAVEDLLVGGLGDAGRSPGLSPDKKSDPIAEAFKAKTGITLPPRLF